MPLSNTFHLKQNGKLLAVLDSCEPSGEMFWQLCNFKPTAAFTEYEALFYEASNTEDYEVLEHIYQHLQELDIVLIDVDADTEITYFILHINGDKVYLRYAP